MSNVKHFVLASNHIKRISFCLLLLISLNLSPISLLAQDTTRSKLKIAESESGNQKRISLSSIDESLDSTVPPAKFYAAPEAPIPDDAYIGTLDGNDAFGPDAGMTCSTITVPNFPGYLIHAGEVSVDLKLSHTRIGDLTVKLRSPDGTILTLLNRPGSNAPDNGADSPIGNTSNLNGTFIAFRDNGAIAETMGSTLGTSQNVCDDDGVCIYAPTPDTAKKPPYSFAYLTIDQLALGDWTLCVGDSVGSETGTFHAWTLNIVTAISLSSSNATLSIPVISLGSFSGACKTIDISPAIAVPTNKIAIDVNVSFSYIGRLSVKLSKGSTRLTVLSMPGFNSTGTADNSNWNGFIRFRDGGGPESETMGSGIGDNQLVCRDDGICTYSPSSGLEPLTITSFSGFDSLSTAGIWNLCVGRITGTETGTFNSWSIKLLYPLMPTAAGATVSGRLKTVSGAPVRGGIIKMTNSAGIEKIARSNPFGYFNFKDVSTGETYIITVESKRYKFTPQAVNIMSDIAELNIMALPD
jgi:Regulatory P domain of the subtilisin-like proprotein convertases and other proteases